MAEFKLVINDPKSGKSYQKVVTDESLVGKKINDTVKGDLFGFNGYEFKIRGGSDTAGFPMKQGLDTAARRKPVLTEGPGFKPKKRKKAHTQTHYFIQKRKTVRGHTIGSHTAQINLLITKAGSEKLEKILGIEQAPVEAAPEVKAEAPKEEKKPEVKETKKEEKPAEEKKEAPKKE